VTYWHSMWCGDILRVFIKQLWTLNIDLFDIRYWLCVIIIRINTIIIIVIILELLYVCMTMCMLVFNSNPIFTYLIFSASCYVQFDSKWHMNWFFTHTHYVTPTGILLLWHTDAYWYLRHGCLFHFVDSCLLSQRLIADAFRYVEEKLRY
jgi:hypothetical protein